MKSVLTCILSLCILCCFSCSKEAQPEPTPVNPTPVNPTPTTTPDPRITLVSVPTDYSTIQEAIDQAESGDTVVVEPGNYSENINFNGKNILLTSRFFETQDIAFISSTVIDGSQPSNEDNGAVVEFTSGENYKAILQGFTLTGGTGTIYRRPAPANNFARGGGGILVLESNPIIRYNIIENNEATSTSGSNSVAGGGGLRIELGSPKIQNNIIQNNTAGFAGGLFVDMGSATISNNLIVENSATNANFGGGGGLYFDFVLENGAGNRVINNTIANNKSDGIGGGLVLAGNTVMDKFTFINNIIYNNEKEEVLVRNGAEDSGFRPTYCLIEGGWATGTNLIDQDPKLIDTSYLLEDDSPCIDAGSPSQQYMDLTAEDGSVVPPSKGAARNDIGAYGGPSAFRISEN